MTLLGCLIVVLGALRTSVMSVLLEYYSSVKDKLDPSIAGCWVRMVLFVGIGAV